MNSRKEENVDLDNKELQNALQIMQFTRRSLFLTGKAGTGKSTFLRYICQNTKKKHVVLAPTGIAAINVCGSTLHSFFKIPFHPLLPNDSRYTPRKIRETLKYSSEKIKLIRELELIIIDEISMVRADIIDFIDKVLRVYSRNMREPFGGKQLLFVGDVYQLEPVVKEDDRQLLSPFYSSPYFFNARVFREMKLVSIELQKVYRQTDAHFINILDHIRTGQPSQSDIDAINKQVKSVNYSKSDNDKSIVITLSTRRDTVDYINQKRLEQLDGDIVTFNGVVKGDFPENSLPTPLQLELKAGAQVIFVKNDSDHRWVNGTLATITCIDCNSQDEEAGDIITVVTENGEEYQVERERWSNMRYRYNEEEKRIEEEEIGTYIQFPIRLAWAITVHKSQGLTFRNVDIDFSGGVFAGGQAYVALSRCMSLDGISLSEPIKRSDVFIRSEIINFASQYNDNKTLRQALDETTADKAYSDAVKAFDKGMFPEFLDLFFKAIHSRYDIEKPVPRRFIQKKLSIINKLKDENKELKEKEKRQNKLLKKLSAEYTLLGKECEQDKMYEAARNNYLKALELYPSAQEPKRRLSIVEKILE